MISKINLKFPECNMQIISNNRQFLNFIKETYYLFFSKDNLKTDLTCKIFFSKNKFENAVVRISGRTTLGKDYLIYNDGPLSIRINPGKNLFECYFYPTFLKHFARLVLRGNTRRTSDYYEFLVQRMIRYPLFYFLEKKGFQLHHSAAIEKNGNAFLFLGLDKMGKSTTSLKMSLKGFKIMSDNFSLIKNNYVYFYLRGVRATDFVRKNLPELKFINLKVQGNKYQVVLDKEHFCSKPTKIKRIFFMRRGNKFKCEKITSEQAFEKLLNISNASLEYPHHHYPSLIPFLSNEKISSNRLKRYQELSKIPAYNLEYSNFKDVEEIEKWLK